MNQHELLTKLDSWRNCRCDEYTLELIREAAAEIRRLQTSVSTVQRDGEYVNEAIGTAEAEDGRGQRKFDIPWEAGL